MRGKTAPYYKAVCLELNPKAGVEKESLPIGGLGKRGPVKSGFQQDKWSV